MTTNPSLDQLTPEQLRALTAQLLERVERQDREIRFHKTRTDQLTHELALLKRHRFARRSEPFTTHQASLLDELILEDISAIEQVLKTTTDGSLSTEPKQAAKRTPLPPELPRTLIHHDPDSTQCTCGCQLQRMGEDVSEKLDYTLACSM